MTRGAGAIALAAAGAILVVAVTIAASFALGQSVARSEPPIEVLTRYLRAMYARDFAAAYRDIAPADRRIKSERDYLAENVPLEGDALVLTRLLAEHIVISKIATRIDGDRASVSFRAVLPDANARAVTDLTERFDAIALAALPTRERTRRRQALDAFASSPALPVIESAHEEWRLVRKAGRWWVDMQWADAVRVRFGATVMAGLPWEVRPAVEELRAHPGETLQVKYRFRNTTERAVTAKSRHVVTPAGDQGHLEIVSCFCFLEQTLAPGEVIELPVVLRVSYGIPEGIASLALNYEVYPVEAFPKGGP